MGVGSIPTVLVIRITIITIPFICMIYVRTSAMQTNRYLNGGLRLQRGEGELHGSGLVAPGEGRGIAARIGRSLAVRRIIGDAGRCLCQIFGSCFGISGEGCLLCAAVTNQICRGNDGQGDAVGIVAVRAASRAGRGDGRAIDGVGEVVSVVDRIHRHGAGCVLLESRIACYFDTGTSRACALCIDDQLVCCSCSDFCHAGFIGIQLYLVCASCTPDHSPVGCVCGRNGSLQPLHTAYVHADAVFVEQYAVNIDDGGVYYPIISDFCRSIWRCQQGRGVKAEPSARNGQRTVGIPEFAVDRTAADGNIAAVAPNGKFAADDCAACHRKRAHIGIDSA